MLLLLLCLSVCCCCCCCCCCCVCESVCVCVCSVCVCSVCSVCSALRACGAYNPTELKRLQHGQKITNMLENQVQQHMVFKKESCRFFGLFQGKFFAFSKALESCYLLQAICIYMYNAFSKAKTFSKARPFPRHDYPFPRPETFFKATSLFQGHKPFSRPPAFFKATSLFQTFFKATSLFQGNFWLSAFSPPFPRLANRRR